MFLSFFKVDKFITMVGRFLPPLNIFQEIFQIVSLGLAVYVVNDIYTKGMYVVGECNTKEYYNMSLSLLVLWFFGIFKTVYDDPQNVLFYLGFTSIQLTLASVLIYNYKNTQNKYENIKHLAIFSIIVSTYVIGMSLIFKTDDIKTFNFIKNSIIKI